MAQIQYIWGCILLQHILNRLREGSHGWKILWINRLIGDAIFDRIRVQKVKPLTRKAAERFMTLKGSYNMELIDPAKGITMRVRAQYEQQTCANSFCACIYHFPRPVPFR